jgi:uncharacterized protein DUF935
MAQLAEVIIPTPRREPQLSAGPVYRNPNQVRAIIDSLNNGEFMQAAMLRENMLSNSRLRGVQETRLNGLIGTAIRWEPGRKNRDGRLAAKLIEDDWPLIASDAWRKQNHGWGLDLGISFSQKHWYVSESSGRLIPRLQLFHPQWAFFDWRAGVYIVQTADDIRARVEVPSPSLLKQREVGLGLWVVHEPFGQHSWRLGLIHAAWEAWLGHQWAQRDQSKASEKLGNGTLKAFYPASRGKEEAQRFVDGLRGMNAEGVIPCAEYEDGSKFNAEPLEFSGAGYEMIHRTKDSKAVDLAVLYLGHNLTTEAKGGSYAAANIGDLIRGDIKAADAKSEGETIRGQVLADWAEANFGDPELAPTPIYETDPPAVNEAAARTLQQLAQAVMGLGRAAPQVDIDELLSRFRIPLKPASEAMRLVGDEEVPSEDAPASDTAQPANAAAQGESMSTQTNASTDAAASAAKQADAPTAQATLALTPTHIAAIVRVNEGRRSLQLPEIDAETGALWIQEHASAIAAQAPIATGAPMPGENEQPGEVAPDEGGDEPPPADEPADEKEPSK